MKKNKSKQQNEQCVFILLFLFCNFNDYNIAIKTSTNLAQSYVTDRLFLAGFGNAKTQNLTQNRTKTKTKEKHR